MKALIRVLVGGMFGVLTVLFGIALVGHAHVEPVVQTEHRTLLPEAEGAIVHVVMHWTPGADALLSRPYADFLQALDPSVKVTFFVPRGMPVHQHKQFERRITAIDPSRNLLGRVEQVEVDGPITAWSKDRALVGQKESVNGQAHLIIPAEPTLEWKERHNDWKSVSSVTANYPALFKLDTSPFDFDAGDIAVARGVAIIDSNLLEKNRRRGYSNLPQLAGRLGEYLKMQVVTLGHEWGDTPRHHLSMYMTPLAGNHVLVGDPRAAASIVGEHFVPGDLGVENQEPLEADFSLASIERFDRAKQELKSQGFDVTPIVNVPFDDKTYLSYTNGVFEVRGGRKIAYVPAYDLPALDDAAQQAYRKLGWDVVPIHVRALYPFHGTIGCVVNVLSRR